MSHNSKYYTKKLKAADGSKCRKLEAFRFKKSFLLPSDETSEIPAVPSPPSVSEFQPCKDDNEPIASVTDHVTNEIQIQSEAVSSESETCNDPDPCVTDNESQSSSSSCQVSDARKFSSLKYENKYPWLYHSAQGYLCKYCELFGGTCVNAREFVNIAVGLGTHPTRKLEKHQSSEKHIFSVERYAQFSAKVNVLDEIKKHSESTKEANRSVLKKLFRCLYFMIRQKWAVTENFESFVRFIAELGVEDLQRHISNSEFTKVTYMSSKIVTQMTTLLSDLIESSLLNSLRTEKFALLADESTDNANRMQLSVMARWNMGGNVNDHYMGLIHLDRARAEDICKSLQSFFVGKNIPIENMRFMAFDGCNTMSGEEKGLQRRMRHLSPLSFYINCRNHKLALCLKHLAKDIPLLAELDKTLLCLWKMFEYSPLKAGVFRVFQETYGLKPMVLIKASMTRWLSHLHACLRVIERYETIVDTLDSLYNDLKEPEIFGVRHILTRKDVVAMMLLLCDVLKPVNILNLCLQSENVNFTNLDQNVQKTIDALHEIKDKYQNNNYQDTEFAKIDTLMNIITERTALGRRVRGAVENLVPQQFLLNTGIPFIFKLTNEIQDAFHSTPLLKAFGALDPRNLPEADDLQDYGNEEYQRLADFYGQPKEDIYNGHTTVVRSDIDIPAVAFNELKVFKPQLLMMSLK
ncbi:unnamed protein product [Mytilus edulis]|uniref:DUF4371 domain-containing protein n=1 Tax=Mytilus edulis TaxID=6550 RepID=A0A8S3SU34_MYTED|nr:unnamed protein product [Mytilus edulis]